MELAPAEANAIEIVRGAAESVAAVSTATARGDAQLRQFAGAASEAAFGADELEGAALAANDVAAEQPKADRGGQLNALGAAAGGVAADFDDAEDDAVEVAKLRARMVAGGKSAPSASRAGGQPLPKNVAIGGAAKGAAAIEPSAPTVAQFMAAVARAPKERHVELVTIGDMQFALAAVSRKDAQAMAADIPPVWQQDIPDSTVRMLLYPLPAARQLELVPANK